MFQKLAKEKYRLWNNLPHDEHSLQRETPSWSFEASLTGNIFKKLEYHM